MIGTLLPPVDSTLPTVATAPRGPAVCDPTMPVPAQRSASPVLPRVVREDPIWAERFRAAQVQQRIRDDFEWQTRSTRAFWPVPR